MCDGVSHLIRRHSGSSFTQSVGERTRSAIAGRAAGCYGRGRLQALRVDRDRSRKVVADENRPEDVRLETP